MGFINTVFKALSRIGDDSTNLKSRNVELSRSAGNAISLKNLKGTGCDDPETPTLKSDHGKSSTTGYVAPHTIDLLRVRGPSPLKANAFSEPSKKMGQNSSMKAFDDEALDTSFNNLPSFLERTSNSLTEPDNATSLHPHLSSFQTSPSSAKVSKGGDILPLKSVSEKLHALLELRDKMTLKIVQHELNDREVKQVPKITMDDSDKHIIETHNSNFALEVEGDLHRSLNLGKRSPEKYGLGQERNHLFNANSIESPKLYKRRQNDIPGPNKRRKSSNDHPCEAQQQLTDQLQMHLEMDPIIHEEVADKTKATTNHQAPSSTELDIHHGHNQEARHIKNKESKKKHPLKIQKSQQKQPEIIDLSIFDLDEDSPEDTFKEDVTKLKTKPKRKETMAQKMKRLKEARRAAKKASKQTKDKERRSSSLKEKLASHASESIPSKPSDTVLNVEPSENMYAQGPKNAITQLQESSTTQRPESPLTQQQKNSVSQILEIPNSQSPNGSLLQEPRSSLTSAAITSQSGTGLVAFERKGTGALTPKGLDTLLAPAIPAPKSPVTKSVSNSPEDKDSSNENSQSSGEKNQGKQADIHTFALKASASNDQERNNENVTKPALKFSASALLGLFFGEPKSVQEPRANEQLASHETSEEPSSESGQDVLPEMDQLPESELSPNEPEIVSSDNDEVKELLEREPEAERTVSLDGGLGAKDAHGNSTIAEDKLSDHFDIDEDSDIPDDTDDLSQDLQQNEALPREPSEEIDQSHLSNLAPASKDEDEADQFKSFFVLESPQKTAPQTTLSTGVQSSQQDEFHSSRDRESGTITNSYGLQFDEELYQEYINEMKKHVSRFDDAVEEKSSSDNIDDLKRSKPSTSPLPEHNKSNDDGIEDDSPEPTAPPEYPENGDQRETIDHVEAQVRIAKHSRDPKRRKRVSKVRNMLSLMNSSSEEDFSPDEDTALKRRVYMRRRRQHVYERIHGNESLKVLDGGDKQEEEVMNSQNLSPSKQDHQLLSSQLVSAPAPEFFATSLQIATANTVVVDRSQEEQVPTGDLVNQNQKVSELASEANAANGQETLAQTAHVIEKSPFSNVHDLGYGDDAGDANLVEVERTESQVYSSNPSATNSNSQPHQQSSSQLVHSPTEKRSDIFGPFAKWTPNDKTTNVEEDDESMANESFDMSAMAKSIEDVAADPTKSRKRKHRLKVKEGSSIGVDNKVQEATSEKGLSGTEKQGHTSNVSSQIREGLDAITKVELDLAKQMLNELSKRKADGMTQSQMTHPVQPSQPGQPEESVQSVQPSQTVQPEEPIQSVQPLQQVQPSQSVQSKDPVQPVQPAQPVRRLESLHSTRPLMPLQPKPLVQPVRPFQPVQPMDDQKETKNKAKKTRKRKNRRKKAKESV